MADTINSKRIAIKLTDESVQINSPKALAEFAETLKTFVVEGKLFTAIKGKNFVHVEGWQFAGACMGIFARTVSVENLSGNDKDFKYRAEVELYQISTDKVIGRAVALCSSSEHGKKDFDEYAVMSMAQTRATSKAFRLSIGWIMKLAGYEATPAEEVNGDFFADETPVEPETPIDQVKEEVHIYIESLGSVDKVKFIKDNIGKVSLKDVTENHYRILHENIKRENES